MGITTRKIAPERRRLRDANRGLVAAILASLCMLLVVLCVGGAASADAALVHPFLGSLTKPQPTEKKQPVSTFSPEVCGTYVDPSTQLLYVADMGSEVTIGKPSEDLTEEVPSIEVLKIPPSGLEATPVERLEGKKTPEHELHSACSIAVNDKTGKVFVANEEFFNDAVFVFNKNGEFEKSASIFNPRKGAGFKAGDEEGEEFSERLSIAVNEQTGTLYVGDAELEQVFEYNESGAPIGTLAFPEAGEHGPMALAVDQASGQLYVAVEGVEPQFAKEEKVEETGETLDVFVFSSTGTFERSIEGRRSGEFAGFGLEEEEPLSITALAVGPKHELYVADPYHDVVDEFSAAGVYLGAITGPPGESFHQPMGVAVDSSGRIYVADSTEETNSENGETLHGAVDVFGPAETGVATIESSSVADVTAHTARLLADIAPTEAEHVTYFFELCTGTPASCTDVPTAPGAAVAGEGTVAVQQEASGLLPNTLYTYRVILHYGASGEKESVGQEGSFRTSLEGSAASLPDGRAWERVSPAPPNYGASYEAITKEGGLIQASSDGNSLAYLSTSSPVSNPEGNRNPSFNQLLAHRTRNAAGELEWKTQDLTVPVERAVGSIEGQGTEYRFFSPDLSLALVDPVGSTDNSEPPLTSNATEHTQYVRHNEACPGSSCWEPLLTAKETTGETGDVTSGQPFGAVSWEGASPDLAHSVLDSTVPLTGETAGSKKTVYEWSAAAPPASRLHVVSILPSGQPAAAAELPASYGPGQAARHAISEEGRYIVWSAEGELYDRDMNAGASVELNEPEPGVTPGYGTPNFVAATPDGLKVFFTDTEKLTQGSSASTGKPDLYEYDLVAHKLYDVAPDPRFSTSGEPTAVQGTLIGMSEEGADQGDTVYFVANGVLDEDANQAGEKAAHGSCKEESRPTAAEICNLYVSHFGGEGWSTPRFIARLAETDREDWRLQDSALGELTSRVSPNGRYLAFMSERPLTGYDNRDAAPAARDARDEEVFLYDDQASEPSQALKCVSCNPTGARPHGVFDTEGAGEGLGLLVDRVEVWPGRWLAANIPGWTGVSTSSAFYQSSYLNDDGRMFFNSADALVTGVSTPLREEKVEGEAAQVGVSNVYEFEPSGVGSCTEAGGCVSLISSGTSSHESAFLDASTSGDDVFFLTGSALVASDEGTGLDVYDARVCGSEGCIVSKPKTNSECGSGEGCHGPAPSAPSYGSPASSQPGTGNVSGEVLPSKEEKKTTTVKPLTRAQKLKKALAACHKLHKKKKRQQCERTARKRYGPIKKKTKKKAHKSSGPRRRPA